MRYTTCIDIREYPAVYRNHNARLVYLHLVLISGYHDHDRDLANVSLRALAADVGITLAATRHATAMLQKFHLLERQGSLWLVKKWTVQDTITPRPKSVMQQKAISAEAARQIQREKEQRAEQIERAKREQMWASGKTPFMLWYEDKMRLAEAGDEEAKKSVEKNRETYESHLNAMKK